MAESSVRNLVARLRAEVTPGQQVMVPQTHRPAEEAEVDLCRHGLVPRDNELGIATGSTSPGLTAMLARAGATVPFGKARDLIADLAGIEVTAKRVERCAEAAGTVLAETIKAETDAILARRALPLPPNPAPDILYIAIDGTGCRCVRSRPPAGQASTPTGAPAPARPSWPACSPRPPSTRKVDRSATPTPPAFEPAARFGRLALAESRRRGGDHIHQLVVLGDGVRWIWNQAATLWPQATQIIDLFHAREHLHEIAGLLAETLGDEVDTWVIERLAELDAGGHRRPHRRSPPAATP